MEWLSRLLAGIYLAAPPTAAAIAAWRARKAPVAKASVGFMVSCAAGSVVGTVIAVVFARAVDGHAPFGQIALTVYVCIGVLCTFKGLAWLLREGAERLFRVRVPVGQRNGWWVLRATAALTTRVMLLFVIIVPYVMAVAMVYRPKVVVADDPRQQLGYPFQAVRFQATDGTPIDGWWVPAINTIPAGQPVPPDWGQKTVVVCHGLGANKANQLIVGRDLIPHGYNVLTFDFRAHGSSGGQVSTFGDLERRDVLGAVRWLKQNRPQQAQQVYGVGISMGGAALIAAAADPSDEGRAIEKVAVYDTYDDLSSLADSISDDYLAPPLSWLTRRIALPIASAHAGTDLMHFSPAALVDGLAPRPLLVIHGRGDKVIDFHHGVRLFDRASQPKLRMWVGKTDKLGHYFDRQGHPADHDGVILDDDAAAAVRLFFEAAEPVL